MKQNHRYLVTLLIVSFLLTACSAQIPSQTQAINTIATATQIIEPASASLSPTPIPTATNTEALPSPTQTATSKPTATPEPTLTPSPAATFPPELTQTPGIFATTTAFAAAKTAEYENALGSLGPLADLLQIGQYYHPVGTPVSSWHDLPVMPQATQGQEFRSDIYSYTAAATLSDAQKYYANQSISLHWACNPLGAGTAGSGVNAEHNSIVFCQGFVIRFSSFDNDPANVIVVLNKVP